MATKLLHSEPRVATPVTPPKSGSAGAETLAMAGIVAIVLAALGLLKISPVYMSAVAVVVLGAAIALAGSLFARASKIIFSKYPAGRRATFSGFASVIVLGLAALVCGVLALAGVSTLNLMSIGVMILGMSLWVGFVAVGQFDQVLPPSTRDGRRPAGGSPALNIFCGVVAASLGILAWLGVTPGALTLVSELFIGIAVLNIGYSISRRAFPRSSPHVRNY